MDVGHSKTKLDYHAEKVAIGAIAVADAVINGEYGTYHGEVNERSQAHGFGKFTQKNGIKYTGFFKWDKTVGFCEKDYGGYVTLG